MDENTKISDLTVAQFRMLMQECFDADRKAMEQQKVIKDAVNHYAMRHGTLPPQPWEEWYRDEQKRYALGAYAPFS